MRTTNAWVGAAAAAAMVAAFATPAQASGRDVDGDGIPNRWERRHDMDPRRAADALRDFDHDRLSNRAEYRLRIRIRDEDSDNDGHDDGDEVLDRLRSTDVDDRNTDDDRLPDGDEDADHDGVANEDEDDARESCRSDDDDADHDRVDDEDENELGLLSGQGDSDDDGVRDGEEDDDRDGESNEDEDDSDSDKCDGDRDGDGEDDEDERDRLGTIDTYNAETGELVVALASGGALAGVVTDDTEIEFDCTGEDDDADEREASQADLIEGAEVAEVRYDDETGDLEEVEIFRN